EDVSSLIEVLYKLLRGTARSIIRWLLKCSNVSPPPTRSSDLVRVLEATNLTDVVVHPTEHTPFYVSITIFVLVSFVLFYVLMVAYSWLSAVWNVMRTAKTPDDPSRLPVVQPDQIGFEERPPKFKVKMSEPVHVHLVESTKKRSEAAAKPKKGPGSIRDILGRSKVESIVEIPMQTAPPMLLQPGSVEKILDRDSIGLASTQSSQSRKTTDIPPTSTTPPSTVFTGALATTTTTANREAAGRGYDCTTDLSSGGSSVYLEEVNGSINARNYRNIFDTLSRSPTAAEQKALSLIFGDSEDDKSVVISALRRRKPQAVDFLKDPPLAKSTPRRRRPQLEVSFREPSEYELSLGVRYGAGAEIVTPTTSGIARSPKKYTPCSKVSSLTIANDVTTAPPDPLRPTIGLLPLSTECAVRAGCRECQLQPLHAVVLRWSEANSKTVFVSGSFVNWNSKIPMRRDRVGWVVELRVPRGHHEYRFIVDGKWALDRGRLGTIHATTASQKKGAVVNHIVHVN
ncbi:hypothetical protein PENTCL1PPCAC_19967, partial [Pristionchus entomophagus]